MAEYATNGAKLMCDKGASATPLTVTSNSYFSIQGQFVATVADKAAMTNIKPFGICSVTQKSCIPSPLMWEGDIDSFELDSGNCLLQTSKIRCALGGCIKFMNSGQMGPNKVETHPDSPQITALEQAALFNSALVEECGKKEQPEKKLRITDVYWKADDSYEKHYDLFSEQPVTLYIETIDFENGEEITLKIKYKDSKGNMKELVISSNVNSEGIAVIEDFKIKFDE